MPPPTCRRSRGATAPAVCWRLIQTKDLFEINPKKTNMPSICFYFQVHQPFRIRRYSFFDIGQSHLYEDEQANMEILNKVAEKCYLPTNRKMLELIKRHNGNFRISYSLSGMV